MRRTEQFGDATLILGDCLEVMAEMEPGSVDAVVTDPPYSDNTHKMAKTNQGKGHGRKLIGFDSLDDAGFVGVCDAALRLARGWVVMTCDHRHAPLMFSREEFVRLGAWVVWGGTQQGPIILHRLTLLSMLPILTRFADGRRRPARA